MQLIRREKPLNDDSQKGETKIWGEKLIFKWGKRRFVQNSNGSASYLCFCSKLTLENGRKMRWLTESAYLLVTASSSTFFSILDWTLPCFFKDEKPKFTFVLRTRAGQKSVSRLAQNGKRNDDDGGRRRFYWKSGGDCRHAHRSLPKGCKIWNSPFWNFIWSFDYFVNNNWTKLLHSLLIHGFIKNIPVNKCQ